MRPFRIRPLPPREKPDRNRDAPASPIEEQKSIERAEREPPGEAPDGMVWVPGGSFCMGADDASMADARPVHEVHVSGFWMDSTEVTNRQFARFVKATGYVTVAERKPDAKDFPDAPPEKLVPGSIVFTPPSGRVSLDDPLVWWRYVPGASWRHPEGPRSTIDGKDDYPVVQICWYDAIGLCELGGQAAADRGRVGICGARQACALPIRVGR